MKHLFSVTILLLFSFVIFSQKVTVSGYIENSETSERIIGANVYNQEFGFGTASNVYGFYSLTFKQKNIRLTASFIGYQSQSIDLILTKDTVINFSLIPNTELEEVIVTGKQNTVQTSQMSSVDIPLHAVKKLPVLFGETDVLKTIQLMPGVQSGSEGTSGVYVRGGGPDQNLILLDGVPVYNVNHLFGFFSVFNGYAVNDITLIKGGFPARYGGRLSSVIDIRMKEGNMKKFSGEASSSFIASKISFEGPIIKDKASFIISARRTYIDAITAPFIKMFSSFSPETGKFSAGYFFYDINAKVNSKFSDKDRVFLSVYTGKDKAYVKMNEDYSYQDEVNKYSSDFDLHWGNLTSALRWNHVYTPKLFGNTTLTYSRYNFITAISEEDEYTSWNNIDDTKVYKDKFEISYLSGIEDYTAKLDYDYLPSPNHKIKFGANGIYHIFKPGISALRVSDDENKQNVDTTYGSKNIYAREYAVYAEDDIRIGKIIKVNIGGRASGLSVQDTFYYSLEPRISARFLITDKWSIKAAYSEMTQYLHFLTNSTIGLPTDLWLPATKRIPPQHSVQYAAGTAITLPYDLNLTLEAYYKDMTNLIEYKEGASFFEDPEEGSLAGTNWEDKVEIGKGNSYGAEVMLSKNIGNLTGWLAYTWSKTNRQFENISFGQVFPYRYDRRHDASIALTYKFNDKIDVGATWVYGTGISVTLAQQRYLPLNAIEDIIDQKQNSGVDYYYYGGGTVEYYGKRNNYRLPNYHRLDLSINFNKKVKYGVRTWNISVYNAYNRKNAFYVDFTGGMFTENNSNKRQLMKYSLFPIIPSVSYTYKFK
ncbi:MAG: TonB-dependent receptor plug domain-containing protein [Chlorobi bacterium]|nr:TonB-dependent receptor plug domain-containing protein [Chlorobiota bacterium]